MNNETHSPQAESSCLAEILRTGVIPDDLRPHHFYDPKNEAILKSCLEIRQGGDPVDLVTVATAIGDTEIQMHLVSVSDAPGSNAAFKIVMSLYARRQRITIGLKMQRNPERWRDLVADLDALDALGCDDGELDENDLINSAIAEVEENIKNQSEGINPLIPTGVPFLDEKVDGYGRGDLVIVGASTGVGKTSLALQFFQSAIGSGKSILFISREMGPSQLLGRVCANYSKVSVKDQRAGTLTEEQRDRYIRGMRAIQNWPGRWDIKNLRTVADISRAARNFRKIKDAPLDGIVIDYLGLLKGDGKTKYDMISNISMDLKELATTLNIPVLCLAQLRRLENGVKPNIACLRDSGQIEQDADTIILLWRAFTQKICDDAEIIVGKHRHMASGSVIQCGYHGLGMRFVSKDDAQKVNSDRERQSAKTRRDQIVTGRV